MKIKTKIFFLILSIILLSFLLLFFAIPAVIERNMVLEIEDNLLKIKKQSEQIIKQKLYGFGEEDLKQESKGIVDEIYEISKLRTSIYNHTRMLADSGNFFDEITPEVIFALEGKTAYRKTDNRIYFAFPVKNIGAIRIIYPIDSMRNFIAQISNIIFWVIFSVSIVAVFLAMIITRTISAPIIRLNKEAQKIKAGNYVTEIKSSSRDEIGELTESFVEMAKEIKKKVEQLQESLKREKELKNIQHEFLSSFTHEFKTPLTSIIGYSDLLKNYRDDKELIDNASKVIRKESERLYQLVEKVLYLARMGRYNFEPEFEEFWVEDLINETLAGIKIKAGKKRILIRRELKYRGRIEGDFNLLYRMLINLLDNAVKYNEEGGKVSIQALKENDKLKLIVADSGIGIDETRLERIFEPFFREDQNRARKTGGDGLGLSIVKEIVKKHNGEITIESKKGEGTKVIILLPLKKNN